MSSREEERNIGAHWSPYGCNHIFVIEMHVKLNDRLTNNQKEKNQQRQKWWRQLDYCSLYICVHAVKSTDRRTCSIRRNKLVRVCVCGEKSLSFISSDKNAISNVKFDDFNSIFFILIRQHTAVTMNEKEATKNILNTDGSIRLIWFGCVCVCESVVEIKVMNRLDALHVRLIASVDQKEKNREEKKSIMWQPHKIAYAANE